MERGETFEWKRLSKESQYNTSGQTQRNPNLDTSKSSCLKTKQFLKVAKEK